MNELDEAVERVEAYLDALDDHNEQSGMRYGDVVHGYNDAALRRTDLRTILRALKGGDR